MQQNYDLVVVGGGILGLSLARAYRRRYGKLSILVLEKENYLGAHGSGRNSGVLHSGVYYPETSLKAKFSSEGAKALKEFCKTHGVLMATVGKVILPINPGDDATLDMLLQRGKANGAEISILDAKRLKEIEPLAISSTGRAIHVPGSTVVDPAALVKKMGEVCTSEGIVVALAHQVTSVNVGEKQLKITSPNGSKAVGFGHLVNSAGIFADKIAHAFDIGRDYAVMPFKGLYYELSPTMAEKIRGNIYPVPDLRLPFLGVHFTRGASGKVYIGPNALPAFGRENYKGLEGVGAVEMAQILGRNLGQYIRNEQGFRRLVKEEISRLFKPAFVKAAQLLVPSTRSEDLHRSKKVGIRAQLFDLKQRKLVMDFLVESGRHSTHILNAISPGFTCGPSFAEHVVENFPLENSH